MEIKIDDNKGTVFIRCEKCGKYKDMLKEKMSKKRDKESGYTWLYCNKCFKKSEVK